jgi:CDP-diacylglycerol pyrophosphatase
MALHGGSLPRKAISLALNSFYNRQERQLHIHVDCLRKDVSQTLERNEDSIGDTWAPLSIPLISRSYRAMQLKTEDLTANPFELLSKGLSNPADSIGEHTIVVIGWRFNAQPKPVDGFILLEERVDAVHNLGGHGEDLQDHNTCFVDE